MRHSAIKVLIINIREIWLVFLCYAFNLFIYAVSLISTCTIVHNIHKRNTFLGKHSRLGFRGTSILSIRQRWSESWLE